MLFSEDIIYRGETYHIMLEEKDNLLMKLIDEHKSIWNGYSGKASATYIIEDYKLTAKDVDFACNLMKKDAKLLDQTPSYDEQKNAYHFEGLFHPIDYTGGIIIAKDLIETFDFDDDYPSYCYKNVYELVFQEGVLVTSIDHNKAMIRIRKNVTKGLRSLKSRKDLRCICKFLNDTFYQNYVKSEKIKKIKKNFYKMKEPGKSE